MKAFLHATVALPPKAKKWCGTKESKRKMWHKTVIDWLRKEGDKQDKEWQLSFRTRRQAMIIQPAETAICKPYTFWQKSFVEENGLNQT